MSGTPVVFIHGLWLHASSWQPWITRFEQAGYAAQAPGWPGDRAGVEATRAAASDLAGVSIDDITSHYAELIGRLDAAPIVVGHSFGGLIAQKLLAAGHARAAVAIDPAGFKGVKPLPLSQLRSVLPVLRNPANRNRAVSLTAAQFRYGFGNAIEKSESDALFAQYTIPGPGKILFQGASANFSSKSEAAVDTRSAARGPLLLIAGGADHTVPEVVVKAAAKLYEGSGARTDLKTFPGRGHSLVIDHGWSDVADSALSWVQALAPAARA